MKARALSSKRIATAAAARPIQIVVTPGSGNGQAMATALELRDALTARRYQSSLEVFSDLDSLKRWAGEDSDDFSLVICVGGDGTQSTTARAAVRRSVPFLPVSSGFGNLFARAFGHPHDVRGALDSWRAAGSSIPTSGCETARCSCVSRATDSSPTCRRPSSRAPPRPARDGSGGCPTIAPPPATSVRLRRCDGG